MYETLPQTATFSWQYVAGFFDGEGNIYAHTHPSIRIYLAQSGERGFEMLTALKDWLAIRGVDSRFKEEKPGRDERVGFENVQPRYRLYIWKLDSVRAFLLNVLPFLHIKTAQVMRALGKYIGVKRNGERVRDFKARSQELEADYYRYSPRCVI